MKRSKKMRYFSPEHWRKISEGLRRRPRKPLIMRFWSKVEITPSCWLWHGGTGMGYGKLQKDGRMDLAHRVAYELFVGPIPEGLELDHLCRNHGCVNPEHLEAVTHQENTLRGIARPADNARKTHCPRGHQYSHRDKTGRRHCRKCVAHRARVKYRTIHNLPLNKHRVCDEEN